MENVYMVCDRHDGRADGEAWDIGVERMGSCTGRILREDGSVIGQHHSSTFGWLRSDLLSKLDDRSKYNVVDLIGKPIPEKFK